MGWVGKRGKICLDDTSQVPSSGELMPNSHDAYIFLIETDGKVQRITSLKSSYDSTEKPAIKVGGRGGGRHPQTCV